jgi:hypothetical protein
LGLSKPSGVPRRSYTHVVRAAPSDVGTDRQVLVRHVCMHMPACRYVQLSTCLTHDQTIGMHIFGNIHVRMFSREVTPASCVTARSSVVVGIAMLWSTTTSAGIVDA